MKIFDLNTILSKDDQQELLQRRHNYRRWMYSEQFRIVDENLKE